LICSACIKLALRFGAGDGLEDNGRGGDSY